MVYPVKSHPAQKCHALLVPPLIIKFSITNNKSIVKTQFGEGHKGPLGFKDCLFFF